MQKVKTVIVDDHILIREGLKKLLGSQQEFEIVGEYNLAASAIDYIQDNEVDLLILDINLPDKSGIDVLNHLKEIKSGLKILVLSAYP
ncbi:MAG: response regulator transcription factor [Ignavibacteriales bacterium]|nr:MAG: response regulator transcription factor [Ignavibacteriales bacterium]